MKLPKRISVLGQSYAVKVVEGLMKDHGAEGMYLPQKHTILIDQELLKYPNYCLRTLWHEIGHAYALESGLHEILDAGALEQFCQTFSLCVIQLTGGKIKSPGGAS